MVPTKGVSYYVALVYPLAPLVPKKCSTDSSLHLQNGQGAVTFVFQRILRPVGHALHRALAMVEVSVLSLLFATSIFLAKAESGGVSMSMLYLFLHFLNHLCESDTSKLLASISLLFIIIGL